MSRHGSEQKSNIENHQKMKSGKVGGKPDLTKGDGTGSLSDKGGSRKQVPKNQPGSRVGKK